MMKNKYTIGLNIFLVLIILTATGCKSSKRMVYADYIMPPKAVSDVTQIQKLIIDTPSITIERNGIDRKTSATISDVFSNTLVNNLSSKLYYNGYIKAADEVYGDCDGLTQVRKCMARSRHGYDVKIVPARRTAKLKVDVNINYTRSQGTDTINTTLVTQNYSVAFNEDGVPYAEADTPTYRYVSSNVPYINIKAKGSLTCSVYDYTGKKIYSRVFDDLEFEKKAGGDSGSNAEAPYPEIAQSLFNDAIGKVVTDISPHRESRALVVNEKGDSSVVALIKGTAFYDAKNMLGAILDSANEKIEKESAEANLKYDQLVAEAVEPEKKTALEQERAEAIVDITKSFSPDFENMGIILEIVGDRNDALEYYQLAANADPQNESAKESLSRIKEMMAASSLVKDPTKTDNYKQAKFQEN
ncbi:tetratricopeptide repeat protein [Maridesulfovibrio sp. FT414]|uniref:tetratricopeptide repeat protein n=1 Tax=Maridesulfovibrio sp. FT414 TaxID=2979469 RepID=UPI003D808F18